MVCFLAEHLPTMFVNPAKEDQCTSAIQLLNQALWYVHRIRLLNKLGHPSRGEASHGVAQLQREEIWLELQNLHVDFLEDFQSLLQESGQSRWENDLQRLLRSRTPSSNAMRLEDSQPVRSPSPTDAQPPVEIPQHATSPVLVPESQPPAEPQRPAEDGAEEPLPRVLEPDLEMVDPEPQHAQQAAQQGQEEGAADQPQAPQAVEELQAQQVDEVHVKQEPDQQSGLRPGRNQRRPPPRKLNVVHVPKQEVQEAQDVRPTSPPASNEAMVAGPVPAPEDYYRRQVPDEQDAQQNDQQAPQAREQDITLVQWTHEVAQVESQGLPNGDANQGAEDNTNAPGQAANQPTTNPNHPDRRPSTQHSPTQQQLQQQASGRRLPSILNRRRRGGHTPNRKQVAQELGTVANEQRESGRKPQTRRQVQQAGATGNESPAGQSEGRHENIGVDRARKRRKGLGTAIAEEAVDDSLGDDLPGAATPNVERRVTRSAMQNGGGSQQQAKQQQGRKCKALVRTYAELQDDEEDAPVTNRDEAGPSGFRQKAGGGKGAGLQSTSLFGKKLVGEGGLLEDPDFDISAEEAQDDMNEGSEDGQGQPTQLQVAGIQLGQHMKRRDGMLQGRKQPGLHKARRQNCYWDERAERQLIEMQFKHGNRWRLMLDLDIQLPEQQRYFRGRTNMDLNDKFKNLKKFNPDKIARIQARLQRSQWEEASARGRLQ